MEDNIYSKLFDITDDNLKQAGKSFNFSKKSYMYLCECNPQKVDILDIVECSNEEFVQSAYVAFLQRLIDDGAFNAWKKSTGLPRGEFQRAVINTLINSQEYLNAKINVKNNIYSNHTKVVDNSVNNIEPVSVEGKLVRVGRKLPLSVKRFLKKMMGK